MYNLSVAEFMGCIFSPASVGGESVVSPSNKSVTDYSYSKD